MARIRAPGEPTLTAPNPLDPASADFVLDEMPGDTMHALLRVCREAGPIVPTRFMGLDARVIAGHEALDEAFRDEVSFPGHRMYQASFEPAIGASFISDPDPTSHLRTRKLATPAFRSRAVSRFAAEGIASGDVILRYPLR